MSCVMRKHAFCMCKNILTKVQISSEVAAQLISTFVLAINIYSTIPLLPKSEIPSLYPSPVAVQMVCVGPGRKARRKVL